MPVDIAMLSMYSFAGNTLYEWLTTVVIFLVTYILLKIFKTVVIVKLKKLAKKTETDIDDLVVGILANIGWLFYAVISLYIASRFINIPEVIAKGIAYITLIVVTFYVVKAIQKIIEHISKKVIKKKEEEKDADTQAIEVLTKITKAVLWIIAFILILSNLGYDITTLVAGLGIGGLAIAFALQNILGDIFASFSIYFDKPFKIGDYIVVGDHKGTVKKIGIKSTRLQTLQGQELVISNKELTEHRLENYKKMKKRRITFSVGVTYDTPTTKLKKIPGMIKKIIDKIQLAEYNRAHFTEFADSSLNFEIVYYIKSKEYIKFRDTQQEINLAIKQQFDKNKIEIAFPTRTIYMHK